MYYSKNIDVQRKQVHGQSLFIDGISYLISYKTSSSYDWNTTNCERAITFDLRKVQDIARLPVQKAASIHLNKSSANNFSPIVAFLCSKKVTFFWTVGVLQISQTINWLKQVILLLVCVAGAGASNSYS